MHLTSPYAITICTALAAPLVLCIQPAASAGPWVPRHSAQHTAAGQESQHDLRQENDRLHQQVQQLQADLEAAQQRIQELEEKLAQLAQQNTSTTNAPSAPTPPAVAPDPALGPGGLLAKLRQDFRDATLGREIPSAPPGADPAGRQAWEQYMRLVDPWITRTQKQVIPVEWQGVIDPGSAQPQGRQVSFTVVFTNGGREYPTTISVEPGMFARLRGPDGNPITTPVLVNGTVTPRLRVNQDRAEAGAFERPPLIAPFVEFGYELRPRVVLPAGPKPGAAQPGNQDSPQGNPSASGAE